MCHLLNTLNTPNKATLTQKQQTSHSKHYTISIHKMQKMRSIMMIQMLMGKLTTLKPATMTILPPPPTTKTPISTLTTTNLALASTTIILAIIATNPTIAITTMITTAPATLTYPIPTTVLPAQIKSTSMILVQATRRRICCHLCQAPSGKRTPIRIPMININLRHTSRSQILVAQLPMHLLCRCSEAPAYLKCSAGFVVTLFRYVSVIIVPKAIPSD